MKQINNFPNVDKFEYILSITRSSKDFDRIESIIEYNNNFYLHTDYKIILDSRFIEINYYLNLSLEDLRLYTNEKISYGKLAEKYDKIIFEKSLYDILLKQRRYIKYYELTYNEFKFLTNSDHYNIYCAYDDFISYFDEYNKEIIKKYNLFENETNK